MERKRLNSGMLRSAGYDGRNHVLEIELTGGSIFQYNGVSEEIYRRLMNSPSPTSYYRDNIEEDYSARRVR